MAIYSTDFSTGTAGSLPSGWTVEYAGEANASHVVYVNPDTGKKEFRLYHEIGGGGFPTNISYSSAGSSSNSEVLALIATPLDSGVLRLLMRYAPGGPSYYSATMWNLTTQTNINISIQEINSGAYSNLASSTSTGIPIGTTSWIRARVDGTTVSYRAWAYGTPEPSTWVSRTDSTLTSGNVGIEYVKRTGETMDIRIQYFAASTAGETIPVPYAAVTADDATHSHIADSPIADVPGDPGYTILGGWGSSVWGLSYAGSGSNLSNPEIGAIQTTHAVTSDNVTLIEDVAVVSQESTHSLTSESPSLTVEKYLVVQDASHTTSSDNAAVKANAIIPQESTHAHTAESPVIIQSQVIYTQESTHGISSETPSLLQDYHLLTNESTHQVSSDIPTILQDFWLLTNESIHTVSSDTGSVYISFEPGVIDTGTYTPQSEGTPAPFPDAELAAVSEYTPQATTSATWSEGTDPDSGSWNSP